MHEYKSSRWQFVCRCRLIEKPELLQAPREQPPWLNGPIPAVYAFTYCEEFLVGHHLPLGYCSILRSQCLSIALVCMLDQGCIPTMTVPRARGLPHSLVSKSRRRSSPVLSDRVSRPSPCACSKPARAALLSTAIHAAVFAAKPSGFA